MNTIYITYILESKNNTNTTLFGSSIHCNYIEKIVVEDISNASIGVNFTSTDDFKFLNTGNTDGFNADSISLIAQRVVGDNKPTSDKWVKTDVTDQIIDYFPSFTVGDLLTPEHLTETIFTFQLKLYNDNSYATPYTLDNINYPNNNMSGTGVNKPLTFGDEEIFIGNVSTEIAAIAHTTSIEIKLLGNEFNTTNNLTWDGNSDIYITEVGIYDKTKNLVAIGKLNTPIKKNNTISRTILFEVDF